MPEGLLAARLAAALSLPRRLRLVRLRARGDHLIVAGDTPMLERMAVRADGGRRRAEARRRIILGTDERGKPLRRIRRAGGLVVGSAAEAGAASAQGAVLLHAEVERSLALADELIDAVAVRAPGNPFEIAIWATDSARHETALAWLRHKRKYGLVSGVRIRIAAQDDLVARHLFRRAPLDRFRRFGRHARPVVAVDDGPTLAPALRRFSIGSHFRDGMAPEYHAMSRADALVDECDAIVGLLPVAVIVDCRSDAATLATAQAILSAFVRAGIHAPPIHAMLADEAGQSMAPMIVPTSVAPGMADPESLLDDHDDLLARAIHEFYLDGRLADGDRIGSRASMAEWDDLDEAFRDDNRLLADCYALKLRDIGARLVPGEGASLRLAEGELEAMARAEHERWMAARLADGWTWGAVRDDALRRHPDIVGYDALSEAIKELDREQIRVMTRLLASVGQRAVRLIDVALMPGELARGVSLIPLIAELAAHYPDRQVRFMLDPADVDAADAVATLPDGAALHRLVLTDMVLTDIVLEDGASPRAGWVRAADALVAAAPDMRDAAIVEGAALVVGGDADDPRYVGIAGDGQVRSAPWRRP